ncbi:MAG: hypothetical protein PVJ10_03070, partial [Thiohalophilus sp.]
MSHSIIQKTGLKVEDALDKRLQQLEQWLREQGYSSFEIEPASADASFRRYFRVRHEGQSFIV